MTGKGDIVLVTGAAGFVGSGVARVFSAQGLQVRALVRPTSDRRNLAQFQGEIVEGDMRVAADVAKAVAGARYIAHVAADYRLWARDPQSIARNNTKGAQVMAAAALEAGVERLVYTSSVATLSMKAERADETMALREDEAIGAYKQSKVAAERVIEKAVAERGLPAIIVQPSTPIGPRDVRPTPTGRIIVEAARGAMPAFVETGLNLVHVDDVAEGHWLALSKGKIGARYILGGQDVSLRDMLAAIAGLTGRKAPTVALPRGPLYPLAYAAEAVARVTGKEPFLSVDALKMAAHHMYVTSAKAEADLGYRARPYIEALRDALAWFRQAGYV